MPDTLLSLTQVARRFPHKPDPSSVWRWCRVGVKSRAGQRIKLGCIRAGGRVYVPAVAVDIFVRELAEADNAYFAGKQTPVELAKPRTTRQRDTAIAQAEAELVAAGA